MKWLNRSSADIDMKRYVVSMMVMLLALTSYKAQAQRFSISTNLIDNACLGTMNIECAYSVSRHWSLTSGLEYNPFTFRKGSYDQFQMRQRAFSLGTRLWLWHTWSGWWMAGKMRYQEYNTGGIFSRSTDEGDRLGMGLYAGYTYMVTSHFNVEFGLGAWTGLDWFRRYDCQLCGKTVDEGRRWFVLPDDIMISLVYVF